MISDELLKAFRLAINMEAEAAKFYADMANKAKDPVLQDLLRQFAAEEKVHQTKLNELYYNFLLDQAPPEAR